MTKNRKKRQVSFDVSDQDRVFLDSVSPILNGKKYLIPEPTVCPDCRHHRRQAWRNESKLSKGNHDRIRLPDGKVITMNNYPDIFFLPHRVFDVFASVPDFPDADFFAFLG